MANSFYSICFSWAMSATRSWRPHSRHGRSDTGSDLGWSRRGDPPHSIGFESPTGSAHGTSYCLRGASPCRLAAIKDQSRRRDGQCEPAHEHLTIATTMDREMDMSFWLARADSELTLGATSWVIPG